MRLSVRLFVLLAIPIGGGFGGCKCDKSTSVAAAPSASVPAPEAMSTSVRGLPDPDVQPVYPKTPIAADPLAKRLCEAIHGVPNAKRKSCCAGAPVLSLQGECERLLSHAIALGGVSIDEGALATCETAAKAAAASCDLVKPSNAETPLACTHVVTGKLAVGAKCRSSLECPTGARCNGGGPTDVGVCGPPRASGSCGHAVETLVAFVPEDVASDHPECVGACVERSCGAITAIGAACKSSGACGPNARCEGGTCVAGRFGKMGDACASSACEPGLGCVAGKCGAPKKAGEACTSPSECGGICKAGTCALGCPLKLGAK